MHTESPFSSGKLRRGKSRRRPPVGATEVRSGQKNFGVHSAKVLHVHVCLFFSHSANRWSRDDLECFSLLPSCQYFHDQIFPLKWDKILQFYVLDFRDFSHLCKWQTPFLCHAMWHFWLIHQPPKTDVTMPLRKTQRELPSHLVMRFPGHPNQESGFFANSIGQLFGFTRGWAFCKRNLFSSSG